MRLGDVKRLAAESPEGREIEPARAISAGDLARVLQHCGRALLAQPLLAQGQEHLPGSRVG